MSDTQLEEVQDDLLCLQLVIISSLNAYLVCKLPCHS